MQHLRAEGQYKNRSNPFDRISFLHTIPSHGAWTGKVNQKNFSSAQSMKSTLLQKASKTFMHKLSSKLSKSDGIMHTQKKSNNSRFKPQKNKNKVYNQED